MTETNNRYSSEFTELEIIGYGSFGIVCRALKNRNDEVFAIKKVPINDELKIKALKEIRILSTLKSERIVKLESFWIENNCHIGTQDYIEKIDSSHELFKQNNNLLLYIQMELCYKTLKDIIKIVNEELNQKISAVMSHLGYYISSEILIELLDCVDYLHKQNIIHRDLKPSNILISDGTGGRFVKLADFGIATIHDSQNQTHTKYSGSARYAAPEVMRGRNYDTKADIFSLGVIAQELFNIDINDPIGNNSDLEINYLNIFDLVTKMSSLHINKRPNCREILEEKSLWALSLDQLIPSIYSRMNDEFKTIEESFYKYFIRTKGSKFIGRREGLLASTTNFEIKKIIINKVEGGFTGFFHQSERDIGLHYISKIDKGSPADKTDLKVGDIIFEVNNNSAFCKNDDLIALLGEREAGIQVELVVINFNPNKKTDTTLSRSQINSILIFINEMILDSVEKTGIFSAHNMEVARNIFSIAKISCRLFLVDRKAWLGKAWDYVLVDEDKMEDFQMQLGSGHINVRTYGFILKSGRGENVPSFDEILDIAISADKEKKQSFPATSSSTSLSSVIKSLDEYDFGVSF